MIYYEQHRANPSGGIYHQRNTNLCFFPHLHDSFELIFVYQGELHISVDNNAFLMQAGQAILIFPNQIHATLPPDNSKTYLCIFQNSLVGEFYRAVKNNAVQTPVFSVSDPRLIEKISDAGSSRYQLKSYLYDIIQQFDAACGEYFPRAGKPMDVLGKILVFISAHYAENITLQTIAVTLGYDHHYLSNLLRKHLNTTFRAILNEYRVSQAKQLLLTSTDTITDIAYECGFESVVSFNRNFKNFAGTTPSDFRKGLYWSSNIKQL